uniref:Uncharacterized protein n=1 Tax=Rhizophora mucronata TaxID=61149 RepID=A0A2P2R089_RHIMU
MFLRMSRYKKKKKVFFLAFQIILHNLEFVSLRKHPHDSSTS